MLGGLFVGETVNGRPLQMVVFCVPITGLGFTVIVKVNAFDGQAPSCGEFPVMLYTKVAAVLVVLVIIPSEIVFSIVPVVPPVTLPSGFDTGKPQL